MLSPYGHGNETSCSVRAENSLISSVTISLHAIPCNIESHNRSVSYYNYKVERPTLIR
jgi:hypothetical protein